MEENTIVFKKPNIWEKFSLYLILILVFFLPLFFVGSSFFSVQFSTSLLFAYLSIASVVIYIISRFKEGSVIIPSSKFRSLSLFVIVPAVYLISFIFNDISRISFIGYTFDVTTVGFILISFIFIFLVSILFNNKEKIFYGYLASVISSIILGLFVILRLIFGADFMSFGIFTQITDTVIGNWNNLGIFFGVGVLLSLISHELLILSLFMKRVIVIALVISMFFVIIVNFMTVSIVLAITSLAFLGYDFYSKRSDVSEIRRQGISKYTLAVFIISLVFVIFHNQLGSLTAKVIPIYNIDVRPNLVVTYDLARQVIKNDPILGSGPNSFAFQWISYKPTAINTSIFWNTDFAYGVGLIPTFIITTGFLGLLSWVVFFITYLYLGFKALFEKKNDGFTNYLLLSSFLVSVFLWIMSIVYIPSTVIFVLTLFFTGLFLAQNYIISPNSLKTIVFKENPKQGFISSIMLVIVLVGVVVLGLNLYKNAGSLWAFGSGLQEGQKGNLVEAEKFIDIAISKVPTDLYYRTKSDISVAKIQNLLSKDLSKENQEEVRNLFTKELSKAIESGLFAKDKNPKNYLNWIFLAKAYQVAVPQNLKVDGAYEQSFIAFNEAIKLNPNNPVIDLLLARLEIDKGDLNKAKEYIASSVSKKQNYLDAYYMLSQIQITEGNISEAIKSVETATIIEPNNPALFFQLGLLHYSNKSFKDSIEIFKKSISLVPDYANAKYFLGLALAQTKDYSSAIKEFEDILKTNPDNAEVKSIISTLKEGKIPFAESGSEPAKRPNLPIDEKNG